MSKQSEALRIAERCESLASIADAYSEEAYLEAAAELRRLRAINGELLEALRMMTAHYCNLVNSKKAGHWEPDAEPEVQFARAAIAKAGEQP